jgi:hypothetical protein
MTRRYTLVLSLFKGFDPPNSDTIDRPARTVTFDEPQHVQQSDRLPDLKE